LSTRACRYCCLAIVTRLARLSRLSCVEHKERVQGISIVQSWWECVHARAAVRACVQVCVTLHCAVLCGWFRVRWAIGDMELGLAERYSQ
jgi:hypothetical protein